MIGTSHSQQASELGRIDLIMYHASYKWQRIIFGGGRRKQSSASNIRRPVCSGLLYRSYTLGCLLLGFIYIEFFFLSSNQLPISISHTVLSLRSDPASLTKGFLYFIGTGVYFNGLWKGEQVVWIIDPGKNKYFHTEDVWYANVYFYGPNLE